MAFKINNKIGPYFQSHKGVRQGDPLSILLFNMVADCITRMMLRAQQNKRIVDLVDHLFSNGVGVLEYADDTILCLQEDLGKARNVKLLYIYE
jgi:hypothetical protein